MKLNKFINIKFESKRDKQTFIYCGFIDLILIIILFIIK